MSPLQELFQRPAVWRIGDRPPRLLLVQPAKTAVALWAAERIMRDGACAMAVLWLSGPVDYASLRRLQLAAAHGNCAGFVYRPRAAARSASPAPLRLELNPVQGRLAVNLLKRRGFATSRMLCLETASNRWADLLTQPQMGVPQYGLQKMQRAGPAEVQKPALLPLRPPVSVPLPIKVPLVERRYPLPER